MEQADKIAIKKLVLDLRHLLEEDIEVVLKRYGLFTNREWLEEGQLTKADAELLAARARMVAAIEVEMARRINRGEATRWYIREVAFTYLNRLVGLKSLEVRGLIDEVITTRNEYGGRSQFHRDFRHQYPELAAQADDALPDMLEAACRIVTDEMIGVLFDPDSESSVVWPRYQTLRQAIELINGLATDVWQEDEIIGWTYQFYNAEEKNKIRKRGKPKLPIEVAVINQFFTPRWVVKYLVDNTLGRLWLEMYPNSDRVRAKCNYLVPQPLPTSEEDDSPKVDDKKFTPNPNSPVNNPQAPAGRQPKPVTEIRLIDPACGAMHFGTYAFEVFQEMYKDAREHGWPIWNVDYAKPQTIKRPPTDAEIPSLILDRNLYGVDIDLRAVQLAALALYLKARVAETEADPQHSTQYRVNLVSADARLTNGGLRERFMERYKDDPKLQLVWRELFSEMEDIAQVGSLFRPEERLRQLVETYQPPTIQLDTTQQPELPGVYQKPRQMTLAEAPGGESWTPSRTLSQMVNELHRFSDEALSEADVNAQMFASEAKKTVRLLNVLSQDYEAVVMNPPYGQALNWSIIPGAKESNSNLYCAFLLRAAALLANKGYVGAITDRTFLLLTSFAGFRERILHTMPVTTAVDLGWGVLDDANVATIASVFDIDRLTTEAIFVRCINHEDKETCFQSALNSLGSNQINDSTFVVKLAALDLIPMHPFCYWAPSEVQKAFSEFPKLEPSCAIVRKGLSPGDTPRFVREHWEVLDHKIGMGWWAPYANGGPYSPYYRDNSSVVLWRNDGQEIKSLKPKSVIRSEHLYGKPGLTYGKRSRLLNVQFIEEGHVYSNEGYIIHPKEGVSRASLAAVLNSLVIRFTINLISGLHKEVTSVKNLPIPIHALKGKNEVLEQARDIYQIKGYWETGDEIATTFSRPLLLQTTNRFDESIPTEIELLIEAIGEGPGNREGPPSLTILLDKLIEIETSADLVLQRIQSAIDQEVFSLYGIGSSDQDRIKQELGKVPDETIWPQMEGKAKDEKRREHVRRLLSYFVLQAIEKDDDGILPFFQGTGHATVLEQLRQQMEMEFGAEAAFQLEDDARKELGRSIEAWLYGPFTKWHTSLYKERPILWHLASPNSNFGVLLHYHKLDKDTLPKIRNVYLRTTRDSLRRQLDAAREAKDYKTVGQLEAALEDLTDMDGRLQAVIEAGYEPAIDDGVKANILPLQEAGLLRYKVV